jgi:VWFA-related protein
MLLGLLVITSPAPGIAAMQWLFGSLTIFILSSITITAQQTSLPSPPTSQVQQAETVTIDVAVSDRSGKPVRGLTESSFTLLDDKHPKNLLSFRAVDLDAGTPAPPIEIVLVIDAINADVLKAEHQREGVRKFLQSNEGKLALPVSLVTVTDSGVLPVEASRDGDALAAKLDQSVTGLRTVNRNTLFSDAQRFYLSLHALDNVIANESTKPGRKLIVWVSPGWPLLTRAVSDTTSKDQRQLFSAIVKVSTALRLGHITLYNVVARGIAGNDVSQFSDYTAFLPGVKSSSQAYPQNLALSVLAVQSGGLVLNGSNDLAGAMADEIAKSAGDAQAFYVLTFQSPHADHADEYHTLQVKVDQPGGIVRTRTGYYAQP